MSTNLNSVYKWNLKEYVNAVFAVMFLKAVLFVGTMKIGAVGMNIKISVLFVLLELLRAAVNPIMG